jgi:hypothetical protein
MKSLLSLFSGSRCVCADAHDAICSIFPQFVRLEEEVHAALRRMHGTAVESAKTART